MMKNWIIIDVDLYRRNAVITKAAHHMLMMMMNVFQHDSDLFSTRKAGLSRLLRKMAGTWQRLWEFVIALGRRLSKDSHLKRMPFWHGNSLQSHVLEWWRWSPSLLSACFNPDDAPSKSRLQTFCWMPAVATLLYMWNIVCQCKSIHDDLNLWAVLSNGSRLIHHFQVSPKPRRHFFWENRIWKISSASLMRCHLLFNEETILELL
jgi:hypothetical protein